jgi:hypothetical protein
MGAGANPIYLGVELPVEVLVAAVADAGAQVLALSLVTTPADPSGRTLGAIRGGLPDEVRLWIGGAGANEVEVLAGVERIASLEQLEQRVALLGYE